MCIDRLSIVLLASLLLPFPHPATATPEEMSFEDLVAETRLACGQGNLDDLARIMKIML